MADYTNVMPAGIGHIAMRNWSGNVSDLCRPNWWVAMAGDTIKGENHRVGMAFQTAYANRLRCAKAIQIHAVAKSTGVLNIAGTVMESSIRSGPVLRMSVIDAVAGFAALVSGGDDAEVEARVATGAARLAMAGLADREVRLGIRAMIGAKEIGSIQRVWCLARAVRMTALTVEAVRKATWCRLVALQGRPVAGRTRISAVRARIGAVISIGIIPFWRVSCKRWFAIVRVTAVTADCIAAAGQIWAMTGSAFAITGIGCRFHRMGGEPALKVDVGVGRGIRTAAGTGNHE